MTLSGHRQSRSANCVLYDLRLGWGSEAPEGSTFCFLLAGFPGLPSVTIVFLPLIIPPVSREFFGRLNDLPPVEPRLHPSGGPLSFYFPFCRHVPFRTYPFPSQNEIHSLHDSLSPLVSVSLHLVLGFPPPLPGCRVTSLGRFYA